jgi:outer membrane biosynthesis protein TonB
MIVQDEVKEAEEKPVDKPAPATPPVSTGIKGPGGEAGLASSGNGESFGGPARKGGSRFGWYAGPVQSRVADALRTNRATRSAKLEGVLVKIWPDSNARISRVEFKNGTGRPELDDAIRQALFGLQLEAAPPEDMPLPIVLRLSAKTGFTAQR